MCFPFCIQNILTKKFLKGFSNAPVIENRSFSSSNFMSLAFSVYVIAYTISGNHVYISTYFPFRICFTCILPIFNLLYLKKTNNKTHFKFYATRQSEMYLQITQPRVTSPSWKLKTSHLILSFQVLLKFENARMLNIFFSYLVSPKKLTSTHFIFTIFTCRKNEIINWVPVSF